MFDLNLLVVPFAAGLIAAFNPCGFAMLPTYLTYFLGLEDEERSLAKSVIRGAKVGLALTLGFVTVFGIFGVLLEIVLGAGARSAVLEQIWILTGISGIFVLVLGVAMLRGFEPVINIPRLQLGSGSREIGSMYLFGVSYGTVSLGCTFGPFIFAVSTNLTLADAPQFASIATFVAYGLGMGAVILFLTVALAAGRNGVARKMRSLLPKINLISGGLLVVAGIYLLSYAWFERDPVNNSNFAVDQVEEWQAWLQNWVANSGAERIGLVLLLISVVAVGAAVAWYRRSNDGPPADRSEPPTASQPATKILER